MDGHHKLIMYGWVVHGIIDGYDRTIRSLFAATNNRAETVFQGFLRAVLENKSPPEHVRGDHGGENVKVAAWMVKEMGGNKRAYMFGTSQHNQRIERFWEDLGAQMLRAWRAFGVRLEEFHLLVRHRPDHLWLLHLLFTEELNECITDFKKDWNNHPMKGRGTHHKSPNELRIMGYIRHGVHMRPEDEAHKHNSNYFVEKYLGSKAQVQNTLSDELPLHLVESAFSRTNHKPVKTPRTMNPFNDPEIEMEFKLELAQHLDECRIPAGYKVLKSEWRCFKGNTYPSAGSIVVGARKRRYELQMPASIWLPRAQKWAIGLDLLERYIHRIHLTADP
ncbi:integrase core domain protein [Ceratobasidium sp. AG-Ba]|nr:integrase core domain protein [Ceratobasidium sp. AG-Ba]